MVPWFYALAISSKRVCPDLKSRQDIGIRLENLPLVEVEVFVLMSACSWSASTGFVLWAV